MPSLLSYYSHLRRLSSFCVLVLTIIVVSDVLTLFVFYAIIPPTRSKTLSEVEGWKVVQVQKQRRRWSMSTPAEEKKMKKVALIIMLALSVPCSASFVEYDRSGGSEQIQVCLEKNISNRVGIFAYSCQTENWGETYVGPELNGRFSNVSYQLAYGIGQETGGFRHGGWIWAGRGKFSAIYLHEDGATGTWDKLVLKCQVNDRLTVGYTKKMYAGQGLYAEYKLGKSTTVKYSGFKTPELGLNVSF